MSLASNIAGLRGMSAKQLLSTSSKVLPGWIAAIIVIGIVWQVANLTVLLLQKGEAQSVSLSDIPLAVISSPNPGSGEVNGIVQSIVSAHIFGEPDVAEPVEFQEVVDKETDLDLTLKGTMAAESEDEARAIIAGRDGDDKVYSIGDAIPGNARLHAIHPDKVILQRAGTLEALKLPREYTTQRPRNTRRPPARRTTTSSSRKARGNLQEIIANDPAKLTDIIRPQPVFRDGRQRGYRVYPGRKRQQFAALGLRSGDLVLEINGTALDDPTRGMEVFRSLSESTQVTVTVERNGQPEVLNLDTSILTADDNDM